MISRFITFSLLAVLSLLTSLVLFWSIGWHLPMYTVIMIPVIIMHVLACRKAYKYNPRFNVWILLSAFAFLAFSLFRTDVDTHGGFSGYSSLLFHLGRADTVHTETWEYSLEITLSILLVQIFLNTYILMTRMVDKHQN